MKKNDGFIFTGSTKELNDFDYEIRAWTAIRNEELSRRELIDDIAITIYDYEGTILCGNTHRIWQIPDVYELMGEHGRWLSYYLQELNGRPKHKSSNVTLERRRLIDLRYRIKFPDLIQEFKSR